uniref:O-acyltransferase n=1 Tax=Photinus pyralis TaxID=7054 RepID=A0A1Y1MTP9_PHOPY
MAPNSSSRTSGEVQKKKYEFKVKVYQPRDSVITEITQQKNLLAVYRIFLMVFLALCINFLFRNCFYGEGLTSSFALVFQSFKNIHMALAGWFVAFLSTVWLYYGFKCWAIGRTRIIPNSFVSQVWNTLWLTAYAFHFLAVLNIPVVFTYRYNLGFASSVAVGMEAMRLLMKSYSVVRSNVPRLTTSNLMKEFPKFSHYMYFLFSPAMVYRDSYPRSKHPIRWRFVGGLMAELVAIILLYSIIFERGYIHDLKNFGLTTYRWTDIVTIILENCLYSIFAFVMTFYLVLHVSQNICAEILQFSDKLFYEDWWTSSSYSRYYRTWNVVVHDWLYNYVYKDTYEILCPGNKFIAKQLVFLLSALFHEYISTIALGFYLPIFMIFFFGFGNYLSYHKFSSSFVGNLFLLYSLTLGSSIMFTTAIMEHYCRTNSVQEEMTISNFFTPKLFTCISY